MTEEKFVLAIDQGTTSTRAIIFNHSGEIIAVGQKEFTQIFPNPGWVEHDPLEIWDTTRAVVAEALGGAEINRHQLAAVGITNQRETTVVWDKNTGEPVYNAIVWQDVRTSEMVKELGGDEGPDRFRQICGLGLSPYFSGSKIKWILDNVEGARERAEAGDLLFGNTDSWVLWNNYFPSLLTWWGSDPAVFAAAGLPAQKGDVWAKATAAGVKPLSETPKDQRVVGSVSPVRAMPFEINGLGTITVAVVAALAALGTALFWSPRWGRRRDGGKPSVARLGGAILGRIVVVMVMRAKGESA